MIYGGYKNTHIYGPILIVNLPMIYDDLSSDIVMLVLESEGKTASQVCLRRRAYSKTNKMPTGWIT